MRHAVLAATTIIVVLVFAAVAATYLSRDRSRDPSAVPVTSPLAEGSLPPPLHPALPDVVAPPDNPCSNLTVSEEIRSARTAFREAIRATEGRNDAFRAAVTLPYEIERGDPERRAVALTVDTGTGGADGIPQLLDIAAHYRIPLTFFLTGCWALENPELTQRIVAEGHSVANHTLTHRNLADASDAAVEREIAETDRILRETVGFSPAIFRKPQYAGGERITELAGRFGMVSVLGWPDFGDTTGWREGVTAEDVLALVSRKNAPGAIWVLHNLSVADLHAFEDVIRFHLEHDYALERVEDLIAPTAQ